MLLSFRRKFKQTARFNYFNGPSSTNIYSMVLSSFTSWLNVSPRSDCMWAKRMQGSDWCESSNGPVCAHLQCLPLASSPSCDPELWLPGSEKPPLRRSLEKAWRDAVLRGSIIHWKNVCSVAQSCPTLYDPMDCSLPGSSVHGIFQARILEWVVISFSTGYSQPRNWTCVPCISCSGRQILYHCVTWETQLKKIPISYSELGVSQVVLVVKNLLANAGDIRDMGSIPRPGKSPGIENGNSLQYLCLQNPMDRGAWQATVQCHRESDTTEVTEHAGIVSLRKYVGRKWMPRPCNRKAPTQGRLYTEAGTKCTQRSWSQRWAGEKIM